MATATWKSRWVSTPLTSPQPPSPAFRRRSSSRPKLLSMWRSLRPEERERTDDTVRGHVRSELLLRSRRCSGPGRPSGDTKVSGRRVTRKAPWLTWKEGQAAPRHSESRILNRTSSQSHKARSWADPPPLRDSHILWCWIDMRDRECSTATTTPTSAPGRRRKPHPEHDLTATHVLQPVLQPGWYTTDIATPPDHRKPPKQARFPDAPGRARTCASKLVAGASQRFEAARRILRLFAEVTFSLYSPNVGEETSFRK